MAECLICLEEVSNRTTMIRLCMSNCECDGLIHSACLLDWVSSNPSVNSHKCPICRTQGTNYTLWECRPESIRVVPHPLPSAPPLEYSTPQPAYHPPIPPPPPPLPPSQSSQSSQPIQPRQLPANRIQRPIQNAHLITCCVVLAGFIVAFGPLLLLVPL